MTPVAAGTQGEKKRREEREKEILMNTSTPLNARQQFDKHFGPSAQQLAKEIEEKEGKTQVGHTKIEMRVRDVSTEGEDSGESDEKLREGQFGPIEPMGRPKQEMLSLQADLRKAADASDAKKREIERD